MLQPVPQSSKRLSRAKCAKHLISGAAIKQRRLRRELKTLKNRWRRAVESHDIWVMGALSLNPWIQVFILMLESYWRKFGYAQDWICLNRNSLFHQKSFESFKPPFLNLIEMMTKHATDALFWWRCFEIHWISQRCLSYSSSDVLWIGVFRHVFASG
jgi:hypothetical protein